MPSDHYSHCLAPDELRADAYERTAPERRARLKKLIAQHYVHAGRNESAERERRVRYRMGFESVERERAVEGVLLLFSGEDASPVRLLAALLPAAVAGASEIAAVFTGQVEDFPADALVALELAGLDLGLAVRPTELASFLRSFSDRNASGRLLHLSEAGEARALLPAAWRTWRPVCRDGGRTPRLGVWLADDGEAFDMDVLAWAQAGARLEIWNAPSAGRSGPFEAFLGELYDAVAVPRSRLRDASGAAPVVLGPGQEAAWIWPDLTPDFFMERSVLWSDDRTGFGRGERR